jgi:hypothetical protein
VQPEDRLSIAYDGSFFVFSRNEAEAHRFAAPAGLVLRAAFRGAAAGAGIMNAVFSPFGLLPRIGRSLKLADGSTTATTADLVTAAGVASAVVDQAPAATDATIEASATRNKLTSRVSATSGSGVTNTSQTVWADVVSVTLDGTRQPLSGGQFDTDWSLTITAINVGLGAFSAGARLISRRIDGSDVRVLWSDFAGGLDTPIGPTAFGTSAFGDDYAHTGGAEGRVLALQIKPLDANCASVSAASGAKLTARYLR